MTLLLALLLAADPPKPPPDPLTVADRIEPAGWNADETRVALRLFGNETGGGENVECPGYVDAAGKKFLGGLTLVVLENGKLAQTFPIQDPPNWEAKSCTSAEVAKERLAKAKEAFAQLGIDLKQPGALLPINRARSDEKKKLRKQDDATVRTWKDTFTAGPALEVRFEVKEDCLEDTYCTNTSKLTWKWGDKGGNQALPPIEFSRNGAGRFEWKLSAAVESPSKKLLLPFIDGHHSHMRGDTARVQLLDTLSNRGPTLK
ncbi:MAG: hypothetical protein U0228_05275 [Myxococcaceae bacterium]